MSFLKFIDQRIEHSRTPPSFWNGLDHEPIRQYLWFRFFRFYHINQPEVIQKSLQTNSAWTTVKTRPVRLKGQEAGGTESNYVQLLKQRRSILRSALVKSQTKSERWKQIYARLRVASVIFRSLFEWSSVWRVHALTLCSAAWWDMWRSKMRKFTICRLSSRQPFTHFVSLFFQ